MVDGQGSVVVQSQKGQQFTINFMKDYVNATNREAQATREGDTWTVTIDGTGQVVPVAVWYPTDATSSGATPSYLSQALGPLGAA